MDEKELEGMGKKVYTGEYDYMVVLPLWGPQSTGVAVEDANTGVTEAWVRRFKTDMELIRRELMFIEFFCTSDF